MLEISKELFWLITTLIGGVIALLTYLWKSKDQKLDQLDKKLDLVLSRSEVWEEYMRSQKLLSANHEERLRKNEIDIAHLIEWKRGSGAG